METYDVIIATPGSMITAAYVRSLARTLEELSSMGITWKYVNYESPYIRGARERIMNDDWGIEDETSDKPPFSGKFGYRKIFWIDSDIEWRPEHFLKLYYSKRNITTGAYMMTSGQIAVSFDGATFPFPNQIPQDREVEVQTCGFGFLCVSRGVFESIPRPWFDSEIVEKDGRLMSILGEDNAWCKRARSAGHSIWLDPNVRVVHNKTVPLVWHH